MSGPLSPNEIEDVVSSVRRLVSVDGRPRTVSRDLAQDRLVLTPALRIVPEAANSPLILSTPVLEGGPETQPAVAPVGMEAATNESAGGAPQAFEAEWEEELWAEPEPPLSELALGAEEAEVIADVVPPPEPMATTDQAQVKRATVQDVWPDGPGISSGPANAGAADEAATVDAAPEGLGKPMGRSGILELSAADMLTDGDGNPLTVLDETALQQIIRQLIREELKGVLGERITQSVRKLVRAEINRALAAHALD